MMSPNMGLTVLLLLLLSQHASCFWTPWYSPRHNGACRHRPRPYPAARQGITPRYVGCYRIRDADVVTRETSNRRLTHEVCFGYCQLGMYQYAGMSNGIRCQCRNEFNMTAITPDADSNCDQRCPGDPNENQLCGGQNFNTLYSLF